MQARQLLARPRRLVPARLLALPPDRGGHGWLPAAYGLGVGGAPQSGPQPAPHTDGVFRAVGSARSFSAETFWADEDDGLLFLFYLHGFADLAAYAAGAPTDAGDRFWCDVLDSWLSHFETATRPAWHPFPLSGRLIAWCSALSRGDWPEGLARRMRASMKRQLRVLRRSVEYDIGGNHLLRNATALVFGGVCLQHEPTTRRGLELLRRELSAQLLADGGHEERSTSYHRAILEDLGAVQALLGRAGRPASGWLSSATYRMEEWLAALAGPDGTLPLLNDAWEGPALAGRSEPIIDLADSGYIVLRAGRDQAVLDVGPIAPPHLPPHAHADALSFVLWADGRPVVVDPGTYRYAGPARDRFRGTSAHSTVEVDRRDQCDLWGTFRAAHMPRVRRVSLERHEAGVTVVAEHDGYRRLSDPVVHRRTFLWLPGAGLVVLDRLLAGGDHEAVSRLPLAPGTDAGPGRVGPLQLTALGPGPPATVEEGAYSPYLGTSIPAPVVTRRWRATRGQATGWSLLREGTIARLDGDRLTISSEGSVRWEQHAA